MYLGPYNAGRFGQMGVSANRPKLTTQILARINFLHKNDPNLFWILNSK